MGLSGCTEHFAMEIFSCNVRQQTRSTEDLSDCSCHLSRTCYDETLGNRLFNCRRSWLCFLSSSSRERVWLSRNAILTIQFKNTRRLSWRSWYSPVPWRDSDWTQKVETRWVYSSTTAWVLFCHLQKAEDSKEHNEMRRRLRCLPNSVVSQKLDQINPWMDISHLVRQRLYPPFFFHLLGGNVKEGLLELQLQVVYEAD